VPDPGDSYDIIVIFWGGARGVLLHRPECTKPTRAARDNLGTCPTLGSESAPAALGLHYMGCSGGEVLDVRIQWSRQGGYLAQSEDDRLLCVLCPYRCGDFGTRGPRHMIHLFLNLIHRNTIFGMTSSVGGGLGDRRDEALKRAHQRGAKSIWEQAIAVARQVRTHGAASGRWSRQARAAAVGERSAAASERWSRDPHRPCRGDWASCMRGWGCTRSCKWPPCRMTRAAAS
jgi:hypothetical protein